MDGVHIPADERSAVPSPPGPGRPGGADTSCLSGTDPSLFTTKMPGIEGLCEALLMQAATASALRNVVHILHDWFTLHRPPGADTIIRYFDQPQSQIDQAITLFLANRDRFCVRPDLAAGQHPLIQFYFLFDCLIEAACITRHARHIAYLSKSRPRAFRGAAAFLEKARHKAVYNYIIRAGDVRIGPKSHYHSELAGGLPVNAGGEIAVKRSAEGNLIAIYINNYSGHYRVQHAHEIMGGIMQTLLDQRVPRGAQPLVFLTHEPLAAFMR